MYSCSVRCATGLGDTLTAVKIGIEGLRIAGIEIPFDVDEAAVLSEELKKEQEWSVPDIEVTLLLYFI